MSPQGSLRTVLSIGTVACFVALRPSPPAANGASPHNVPPVATLHTDSGLDDHLGAPRGPGADCNRNGIPDEQDIAGGTSQDCNANLQPDECDVGPTLAFEDAVHLSANKAPTYAVAIDLDNDGDLDLAISDYADDLPDGSLVLSVLRNLGDGTFASPETYPFGLECCAGELAAADLNGDEYVDLVVTQWNGSLLAVLLNEGDGTFGAATTYWAGASVVGVTVGDFDADGDADLVALDNEHNHVRILFNHGDGTFPAPVSWSVDDPKRAVNGDFDEDGDLDLAVVALDGVTVLLNDGDGGFGQRLDYRVPDFLFQISVADLNADGHLDLFLGKDYDDPSLAILIGEGTGLFRMTTFEMPFKPQAMGVADLDGDGDLDVATSGYYSNSVLVIVNDGEGSVESTSIFPVGSDPDDGENFSVVVGDFDLDGAIDIAAVNSDEGTVSILFNDSFTGEYLPDCNANGTPDSCDIESGEADDCDSDGVPDVCAPDCDENGVADVCELEQDCNANQVPDHCDLSASFKHLSEVRLVVGGYPESVVAGDFDGDGDLDIAGAGGPDGSTYVMLNLGNAVLASPVAVDPDAEASYIATADLDGDGDLDLATAGYPGTIYVHLNNGDATFAEPTMFGIDGTTPHAIAAADLNGDGAIDLVTADQNSDNVSVLLNSGGGQFGPAQVFLVGDSPFSVALADLDGDGDVDLVTANYYSDNLTVLLNDGEGAFTLDASLELEFHSEPQSVVAGDLDADGDVDLAVAVRQIPDSFNPNGGVDILLNNGDATFAPPVGVFIGDTPQVIGLGDVDGDGDLDVAAASDDYAEISAAVVLLNDGSGDFSLGETHFVGENPLGLTLADLNLDGLADITTINRDDASLSVLLSSYTPALSNDCNANEVPDECEIDVCPGDVNGDCTIDPLDLGNVLSHFGCFVGGGDPDCDAADVNGDALVDPLDAGFVLSRFGSCPAG